jgi:hypothetical protein
MSPTICVMLTPDIVEEADEGGLLRDGRKSEDEGDEERVWALASGGKVVDG